MDTPEKRGVASSTLSGGKNTTGHQREGYGRVCPRCGAMRVDNQLGLESLHDCLGWATGSFCGECYVCNTLAWTREIWRVLRNDGTMWINLGDSYNGSGGAGGDYNKGGLKEGQPKYSGRNVSTLKPKDLVGIPWRVALALQADGWILRRDIIWHKPNPMPEPTKDRPSSSHEYLFLFSKNREYYYDSVAVLEEYTKPLNRWGGKATKPTDKNKGDGFAVLERPGRERRPNPEGKNRQSVWKITTKPTPYAHFATYPPGLVEPCIKAGTSERGACPECGKQWERVTEKEFGDLRPSISISKEKGNPRKGGDVYREVLSTATIGFRPTCSCYDERYKNEFRQARSARKRYQRWVTGDWWERVRKQPGKPGWETVNPIVLDPFAGSGTTLMVARDLGRSGVGLDLSFDYLSNIARRRLELDSLNNWESGEAKEVESKIDDLPLFTLVENCNK